MRLAESQTSENYLKAEADRLQKLCASSSHDREEEAKRLRLALEEKQHDLEMAQRNVHQLTSMLQGQASQSETDKAERLQHLAAIQELQRQHGQLARERDVARTEAGERQRALLGISDLGGFGT